MDKKKITGIILASSLALGLGLPGVSASAATFDTVKTNAIQEGPAKPPDDGIPWKLTRNQGYQDDGYWIVSKWYEYKKPNGKLALKHETYIYKDSTKREWIGFSYQTYGL